MEDKILSLESIRNMSIDKIIELYRDGYRLKGIVSAAACTSIILAVDKLTANVGEDIIITPIVTPETSEYNIIIDVDGSTIGSCTTLSLSSSPQANTNTSVGIPHSQHINQYVSWKQQNGSIVPNSISIINPPMKVRASQVVNFQISCNYSVSTFGEWVRFRICSNGTTIGSSLRLLFGTSSGTLSISATIPSDASGIISITADVTSDEFSYICGDPYVISTSVPISIEVVTIMPGVCQFVWNTTGMSGGNHYLTAQVVGQCATAAPLTISLTGLPPPPDTCTSITNVTTTPSVVTVGTTVSLVATAQPTTIVSSVTFKDQSNNILGTVNTISGVATLMWNTTGKSVGIYSIKAFSGTLCSSASATQVTLNSAAIPCIQVTIVPDTSCTGVTAPTIIPPTVTVGTKVTIRANVQPITTVFNVVFKDQSSVTLGTANTVNGVATVQWDTVGKSVGTYNIKAFIGTQCESPSAASITLIPSTLCTSITPVSATPSIVTIGDTISLVTNVQPTTMTFSVDFKDQDNVILASAGTISGVATGTWDTTGKSAGPYSIKAFIGTQCQSPSVTTVTLNSVAMVCTSITDVSTNLTTAIIGGTIILTATAQPTTMMSSVTFKDQYNTILGTVNTIGGIATLYWDTTGNIAGPYDVKASVGTQCESTTPTTVTLSDPTVLCILVAIPVASPTTVTIGSDITLSVIVQPITSSFTVDFKDQYSNFIGSGNTEIDTGIATYIWNTGTTVPGTYKVNAYVGSTCISEDGITVTISPPTATCTSVTTPLAMPSTVALGDILALRATVEPTMTMFTVVFKDQYSALIGSANTYGGTATYNWNTSGTSAGTYLVSAYVGDTCVSPSPTTVTIGSTTVTFETDPQGATIIIGTVEMAQKTNTNIPIFPGLYDYILRLDCYEDITGQVDVAADSSTVVNKSFVKNTGDLSITSNPTGADVYIGIDLKGQTQLSYTCYPEGTYGYYLSLPGYQTFVGSFEIIRNTSTLVNAPLVLTGTPGTGSIYAMSTPPGAKIFLNGANTAKITPDALPNIPVGTHSIRLEKSGYIPWTSPMITVGDNQTSLITANLIGVGTICEWISSIGGWTNMSVFDIMTLVSAYLGNANIGFQVMSAYIMGAVAYYLDNDLSGNALTGCTWA